MKNEKKYLHISCCELLVIIASTGGPVAVQKILTAVPKNFPLAVLIVQHMPRNFTGGFAERLNKLCCINVKEANYCDSLIPGNALIAPGGKQIRVVSLSGVKKVRLTASSSDDIYSPCADITLSSVAESYGKKAVAIILTGMGNDGREGARKMKEMGAEIWAQDEASSIIYGMPKAVIEAGLATHICSLDDFSTFFKENFMTV